MMAGPAQDTTKGTAGTVFVSEFGHGAQELFKLISTASLTSREDEPDESTAPVQLINGCVTPLHKDRVKALPSGCPVSCSGTGPRRLSNRKVYVGMTIPALLAATTWSGGQLQLLAARIVLLLTLQHDAHS